MLDYYNIIDKRDKEVRDPVSGQSFPMSANDIHAYHDEQHALKQQRELASTIVSLFK